MHLSDSRDMSDCIQKDPFQLLYYVNETTLLHMVNCILLEGYGVSMTMHHSSQ